MKPVIWIVMLTQTKFTESSMVLDYHLKQKSEERPSAHRIIIS